jgi:hypothetical protein
MFFGTKYDSCGQVSYSRNGYCSGGIRIFTG